MTHCRAGNETYCLAPKKAKIRYKTLKKLEREKMANKIFFLCSKKLSNRCRSSCGADSHFGSEIPDLGPTVTIKSPCDAI